MDAPDSKIDTKVDALRSEVRSDTGELRSMQHLLMDTMSKLVSRISFIEGILDRRQEALVDDVPSLEMTQDQVLSESFIPTRVSCKGANVLPSSSPGPDWDIFPRVLGESRLYRTGVTNF